MPWSWIVQGVQIARVIINLAGPEFPYLPFSPVKVNPPAPDDRPRLVNVVDLDDAVEVSDPPCPSSGSEAATAQQMKVQEATQTEAAILGSSLRLVLDEV
jgi:hypothetical protein